MFPGWGRLGCESVTSNNGTQSIESYEVLYDLLFKQNFSWQSRTHTVISSLDFCTFLFLVYSFGFGGTGQPIWYIVFYLIQF